MRGRALAVTAVMNNPARLFRMSSDSLLWALTCYTSCVCRFLDSSIPLPSPLLLSPLSSLLLFGGLKLSLSFEH